MTSKGEGYRFLEHTTDALVEAWGPTLETAFVSAAKGLFETMINTEKVEPKTEEHVNTSGHDELELLYNWLEELLLRFEIRTMVYSQFHIDPITRPSSLLELHARAKGEKYDSAKHEPRTEIKAVTYHQMKIERERGQVHVRFLLDL